LKTTRARIALAGALLATASGARAAEVCPAAGEAASGPLAGGTGPADFGAIPEACPGFDVTLRARAALLVAAGMPDYFGSILADAMLRARRPVGARGWLTLAVDAIDYRYVNNGGLASTGFAFGPATVGYDRSVLTTAATTTAAYVRALLPLDTARQNGVETGLEVGASVRARLGTGAIADGGLALTAPLDIIGGELHGRLEPVLLAEVWVPLRPTVALGAGAGAKLELGPTPAFITAVPRLSGRLTLAHRIWLALLLELPVVGTDRTDFIGSLFGGVAL
jgi:hypothetical protein